MQITDIKFLSSLICESAVLLNLANVTDVWEHIKVLTSLICITSNR